MLDTDLAKLYNVATRALNQAVKRNIKRFPEDFMFQLNKDETACLRSQIVILKTGRGGKGFLHLVFTEQGVAMLSSVLKSNKAIQVNIQIMRAFTKLREMLVTHEDLRKKIEEMESEYDAQFQGVFEAIKRLVTTEEKPKKLIGFEVKDFK